MNCKDIALILDDLDILALDSEVRRTVEHHLAGCPACARVWSPLLQFANAPTPPVPAGFADQCAALVVAESRLSGKGRTHVRAIVLGCLVAGAAAAGILKMHLSERGAAESHRAAAVAVPVSPPVPTLTAQPRSNAAKAPELESAQIAIRYRKVSDLAALIESPTYAGLLSTNGSLSVDENANVLGVHDTAANIIAVRQFVAKLDVPPERVDVSFVLALVESDFDQELTGGTPSAISSMILGSGQSVAAALESGQRAGRASLLFAQKLVIVDGLQGSFEQRGGIRQIRVGISPSVRPEKSIKLDIDIRVDTMAGMITLPGNGPAVPSIDTRQLKTQVVLDSGATVMLGGIAERDGRHLLALVTPQLMPAGPATAR